MVASKSRNTKAFSLDKFDQKIINILQKDGRLANQDLAEKIGLSPAATLRRVRTLHEKQIINGYRANINLLKLGYGLIVYVDIDLNSENAKAMKEFENAVTRVDELLECFLMSGETDYRLKLVARDLHHYEQIHRTQLANLPNVNKIRSSFSIRTISQNSGLNFLEG